MIAAGCRCNGSRTAPSHQHPFSWLAVCCRGAACTVGGNAAVNPPPVGHWLFVQGGALDYPYPTAKEGIGLWDTISSGKSTTYATGPFNGKFQALPGGFSSTIFSLWLAATTAPTDVHVEITYNLPCGSATLPRYRREWYNKMTLAAAPKYEAYTNAVGFAEPPVGTFCPGSQNTGASMNVTVTALPGGENYIAYLRDMHPANVLLMHQLCCNPIPFLCTGGDVQFMMSPATTPSFVTAPFAA